MALVTMPDASWVADTGEIPGLEMVTWDIHEPHPRADEVAVVVPPYLDPHQRLDLLGTLPRLELVQLLTAGYDNVTPHLPRGVTLCSVTTKSRVEPGWTRAGASIVAVRAANRSIRTDSAVERCHTVSPTPQVALINLPARSSPLPSGRRNRRAR